MSSNNPFAGAKAGAETVVAEATKIAAAAPAAAAKAEAAVIGVDNRLTTWIKNNASKIAVGVLVLAALVVWKLI